jgi:hypothetical protein
MVTKSQTTSAFYNAPIRLDTLLTMGIDEQSLPCRMIKRRDLLVMAAECERIADLIRDAGASEVVIVRRPAR